MVEFLNRFIFPCFTLVVLPILPNPCFSPPLDTYVPASGLIIQGSHVHFGDQGQHWFTGTLHKQKAPLKAAGRRCCWGPQSALFSSIEKYSFSFSYWKRVNDAPHLSPTNDFLRCKQETENLWCPVTAVCQISVWSPGKCGQVSPRTDFFKWKYP